MNEESEGESIRMAMNQAWQDHHHTRDQTWKALQAELLICAGVIGINWQIQSFWITVSSGILLFIVTLCGIQITLRHRNKVELRKFDHIMNCEEALGLHRHDLISNVKRPEPISFWDAFRPEKANTALFILRMHIAIWVFSILFIVWRVYTLFR